MKTLEPLEFFLTPYERSQAALATVHLEAMRRDRNLRDERRSQLHDTQEGGLVNVTGHPAVSGSNRVVED